MFDNSDYLFRLELRGDHVNGQITAEIFTDQQYMSHEVLKLAAISMKEFSLHYITTHGVSNGTKH